MPAAAASHPAALQQAVQQTLASDLDLAKATHNRMATIQSKHVTADGTAVWDAWAGFDTQFVSLNEMYPRRLRIKKGDRVRWHQESLVNEHHTVTFPFGTAQQVANNEGFMFDCDPDGDSGPGPDVPATFDPATGPGCPGGPSQLELEFSDRFGLLRGNGRFTGGSDYENSGVRTGAESVPQAQGSYTLRFTRVSPDTGFRYLCMIHGPGMAGRVVVSG